VANDPGRKMVLKPIGVLNQSIGKRVIVELKGGREYRGILDGYDMHLNLVIKNAEEHLNKQLKQTLELAIVRGDNVIYISPP
jgi:small nuclear ribonucleoprotein